MLANKTIVLGITGSIAAYKGADLASKLTQAGARVEVIMTESATKFVSPMTFRSLTGRPVVTDMFELSTEFSIEHVALAEAADVVVIAPATANIIAEIAAGIADDMITCTVLATRAPVIIAPAMHSGMWENTVTQENVAKLKARGITFVGPGYGRLASGGTGQGRLVEVEKIIGTIGQVLGRKGDLDGKRVVVTAGGTREAIDPVRFIGNRSSGKMGYAVAEAARDRGAEVTLITAPTALADPIGVEVTHITSAVQMKEAVTKATAKCDALIMAAAVADYMPKSAARGKIKKAVAGREFSLKLTRTPDILSDVEGNFIRVGFAAETTENLLEHAKKDELMKKNLDLVAANDISAPDSGFDVDTNRVILIDKQGKVENLPLMSKREVADKILDRVVKLIPPPQEKFTITLARKYNLARHLVRIPPDVRHFFPEKREEFTLDAVGIQQPIQTRVRRTTEKGETWMQRNLKQLFRVHQLEEGDELIFTVIKPKEEYHVEVSKKK